MGISDLFLSCKKGDVSRVEFLCEQKDVELNVRDKWDSTPLYYACLCGHVELVKYLLERGATCEANSFDGERCLYGALNDEIRTLLKTFNVVTSVTIRRDCYQEFLRRALERAPYSDIEFIVHGQHFRANRCILAARSEYFSEMLQTKWKNKDVIQVSHRLVEPTAFGAILQYLYTARLQTSVDQLEEVARLAKYCRLDSLMEQLQIRIKNLLDFASTKPGVHVKTVCIEPMLESSELQQDLSDLVDRATPPGFYTEIDADLPFMPDKEQISPDVILTVQGKQFFCHKMFFCERSEYFKILIEDRFSEGRMVFTDAWGPLPELTVHNVCPYDFAQVLAYIYQDSAELTQDNVYDILQLADLYLLPGLCRQCGVVIAQQLDMDNVVSAVQTARLFNLCRLEMHCSMFMGANIEKVLQNEEFSDLVQSDAQNVKDRQEVDSIDIIDDIRFHISNRLQSVSDMYEAEQKLALIDKFLEDLNLVA